MTDTFDPADAGCWMARGRPAHHALALADAWRRFPDLPNEAPLGARMARSRERVQALRPLNEAIAQETERQRKAANFAFVERQIAQGSTDSRNRAILHARDVHGYDWDAAVAYANGNHAAIAGWPGRPPSPSRRGEPDVRRLGYDQGFLDGGGRPEDIFDVARRSFLAAPPEPSFEASRAEQPRIARPLPSQWPAPTDTPAPVSWHRRLLVLGASESATGAIGIRAMLRERPGHEAAGLYILGGDSGLHLITATTGATPGDQTALRHALRQGDYTDILVVADDAEIGSPAVPACCHSAERWSARAIRCFSSVRISVSGSHAAVPLATSSPPDIFDGPGWPPGCRAAWGISPRATLARLAPAATGSLSRT